MRPCAAACGLHATRRRVLALLLLSAALCSASQDGTRPGATLGWAHGADSSLIGHAGCTVDRRAVAELSQTEFDAVYLVRRSTEASRAVSRLTLRRAGEAAGSPHRPGGQ
jgi:hypothetical protein